MFEIYDCFLNVQLKNELVLMAGCWSYWRAH